MKMAKAKEIFWNKISKKDSCWEWKGRIDGKGYGRITINNNCKYAHRISWEISFGSIPKDLCVLHKCDNRPCVNPDHLFIGSVLDNQRDMTSKGRHWCQQKTICKYGHAFNEVNTYHSKDGIRSCKTCNAIRSKRYLAIKVLLGGKAK